MNMTSTIKNDKFKSILKKTLIFIGIFFFSFFLIHIFGFINNYGDPINSYGFAKAIKMGQIPYVEFNTISTPLLAMYQSLFLHIYDDFIMINISQALLVSICFVLLYKMFGKKSLILLLVCIVFACKNLVATYNFLSFFILILTIYMEKEHNDKDILIGIILALGVLAKQTVGCFAIIPSIIFYRKDLKKLGKRFVGFLIPCFIFFIYLLWNKALYEFFDLCLFGLFDFGSKNGVGGGHFMKFWLPISLILLSCSIYLMFKNKKDINIYYLILGFLYAFPLFDITHTSFWAMCFVIMLLPYIKINEKLLVCLVFSIFSSCVILLMFLYFIPFEYEITKNTNNFQYNIQKKEVYNEQISLNNFINEYDDAIVIGYFSMMHTIINDKKLSYFDVLYDGNYGYNGNEKMINKIKNMYDQIFIVSRFDYESEDEFSQFSKEIAKYIMDNCEKIDSKYGFDVYYKK